MSERTVIDVWGGHILKALLVILGSLLLYMMASLRADVQSLRADVDQLKLIRFEIAQTNAVEQLDQALAFKRLEINIATLQAILVRVEGRLSRIEDAP